jgi:hypothetical protein
MANPIPAAIYLPRIGAADFEAFRKLLKDEIAANFHEWLERRRQQIEFYGTPATIEVDVSPREFAWFCHESSRAYNMGSLLEFAESVAKS